MGRVREHGSVARMSVDREQVRREAEHELSGESRRSPLAAAHQLASHCLALLAELEQAERERDEWLTPFDGSGIEWHEGLPSPYTYQAADFSKLVAAVHEYEAKALHLTELLRESNRNLVARAERAEAQLAAVPALVAVYDAAEALIDRTIVDLVEIGKREVRLSQLIRAGKDARAKWEQAQGEKP